MRALSPLGRYGKTCVVIAMMSSGLLTGSAEADGVSTLAGYAGSGTSVADWFALSMTVPSGTSLTSFHIEFSSKRPVGDYHGFAFPQLLGHFHHFMAPGGGAIFSHGFLWSSETGSRYVRSDAAGLEPLVDDRFSNPADVRDTTGGTVDLGTSPLPLAAGTWTWVIVAEPRGTFQVSYSLDLSKPSTVSHAFGTGGVLADARDFSAGTVAWMNGAAMAAAGTSYAFGASHRLVAWTSVDLEGAGAARYGLRTPTATYVRTEAIAANQAPGTGFAPEFHSGGPGTYTWALEAVGQAAGRNLVTVMAADVQLPAP